MSRRIPSAPAVLWMALFLLVSTFALAVCVGPRTAWASETTGESALEQFHPTIQDPEVGQPGDDDQPTIKERKRGTVICASPAPPTSGGSSSSARVSRASESVIKRWLETIRAYVGRLGSMLR